MKKAFKRLSLRIRNLVDDCHKKIARWLYQHFQVIIIPKLDVNKFKNSKYVRNRMRLWRHCAFVERLKHLQRLYPSSSLIIPTEEYTSKTCSHCGTQNPGLGRSKIFNCPNPTCQKIFDRDVNSGLNILLKVKTEYEMGHVTAQAVV